MEPIEILEAKVGVDAWLPVIITDDTNHLPVTGLLYSGVTVEYAAAGDGAWSTYTLTSGDWEEIGDGYYWLQIGAGEWISEQTYMLRVSSSGNDDSRLLILARDVLLTETQDTIATMVTDLVQALGGVSGSISGAGSTTTILDTDLTEATDGHYVGCRVAFGPSTDLAGEAAIVRDYDGTTHELTVEPALTAAPGDGDAFWLLPDSLNPLDLDPDHHRTAGSVGRLIWLLVQRWLGDCTFDRNSNQLAVKNPTSGATERLLQYNKTTAEVTQEDVTP